ncbi:MAG: carbohydrate ABC transporter permease [Cyanobacteria bacterium]|nr:carbohydrate ABC transporter permease [Cyanobacteria bacterium CG_2015-16_32_12]NCO77228.1 carbohydrate ABC transporter permease [Cyanobacteria bacterium CG_2015-22_32_23]NCQ04634.1 carbohydrate ABC transporter permease [Cyanobacteria bacterium CG_2015-09_32_10]NCQ42819.1 carbohydrate ABC transporter permease [Cyanobacteria bacterium CG_2015-04_32_10]NCS86064.1 carbohydrate ABC transporter permease [Cyanobacteria bacterium CG_2015-02_32_10]
MHNKKTLAQIIFIYCLLTIIALLMLFPLLWLVSTSFKSPTEDIFSFPPQFIPEKFTFENFILLWNNYPFGRYLINSSITAVLTVILNLLFCSLAAYPLARLNFKGKDFIFALVIATIMIPFQIVMIPLYIFAVQFGLRNNYLGIILPNLASAFGIFLLRQAFQGVPKELEEASRIDGCSEIGIWWHIMLPAVKPAIITLAIFVFIGAWSDFLWPLIVLDRPEYYTLPLGVAELASSLDLNWRFIAAGSVISIAPVLLLFLLLQRYIIPSDASSGVKG